MTISQVVVLALSITLTFTAKPYIVPKSPGSPWPLPQFMSTSDTQYYIHEEFQFKSDIDDCDILQKSFQRYYERIRNEGKLLGTLQQPQKGVHSLDIVLKQSCVKAVVPDYQMNESYTLDVKDGASSLTAEEVWGALRGMETFAQLIHSKNSQLVINKTVISDFPRFQHRGFLIDSSRHFLTKKTIIKHLNAMEINKFNVLHWHIVDYQAFPYQSKVYPLLSEKGAYNPVTHVYNELDVLEVIEEARIRGIRVIPEFDTPGHMNSWGVGYPKLLTKSERMDCPADPSTTFIYEFVKNLFNEVAGQFPDKFFHIGGDEVSYVCWNESQEIKDFMKTSNISSFNELESFYVKKVINIVNNIPAENGNRTPIAWQDIFDSGVRPDKDTILAIWKAWTAKIAEITAEGYKVILCSPWYLNVISYGIDWPKYYEVDPQDFNGTDAQKDLVIGGEASVWGEYVDSTNLLSRSWPRASAVAERLWSAEDVKSAALAAPRLENHRCRLIRNGIAAEPIEAGFCEYEYNEAQ